MGGRMQVPIRTGYNWDRGLGIVSARQSVRVSAFGPPVQMSTNRGDAGRAVRVLTGPCSAGRAGSAPRSALRRKGIGTRDLQGTAR